MFELDFVGQECFMARAEVSKAAFESNALFRSQLQPAEEVRTVLHAMPRSSRYTGQRRVFRNLQRSTIFSRTLSRE